MMMCDVRARLGVQCDAKRVSVAVRYDTIRWIAIVGDILRDDCDEEI